MSDHFTSQLWQAIRDGQRTAVSQLAIHQITIFEAPSAPNNMLNLKREVRFIIIILKFEEDRGITTKIQATSFIA